jgi:hypothetical protein
MNREISFNPLDVKALAEFVLDNFHRNNDNGSDYCADCGEDIDYKSRCNHKASCITKIAQDVLTGLEAPNTEEG